MNKTDSFLGCKIHRNSTRNNNKISNKSGLCSHGLTNLRSHIPEKHLSTTRSPAIYKVRLLPLKIATSFLLRQAPAAPCLRLAPSQKSRPTIKTTPDGGAVRPLLHRRGLRPQMTKFLKKSSRGGKRVTMMRLRRITLAADMTAVISPIREIISASQFLR